MCILCEKVFFDNKYKSMLTELIFSYLLTVKIYATQGNNHKF